MVSFLDTAISRNEMRMVDVCGPPAIYFLEWQVTTEQHVVYVRPFGSSTQCAVGMNLNTGKEAS